MINAVVADAALCASRWPDLDRLLAVLAPGKAPLCPAERTVERGTIGAIVEVTLAIPIGAFFVAFGQEAGRTAFADLRAALLFGRSPSKPGLTLVIRDSRAVIVEVTPDLSQSSIEGLAAVEWSAVEDDYIEWDPTVSRWRGDDGGVLPLL
jgi:hypothetical protein